MTQKNEINPLILRACLAKGFDDWSLTMLQVSLGFSLARCASFILLRKKREKKKKKEREEKKDKKRKKKRKEDDEKERREKHNRLDVHTG